MESWSAPSLPRLPDLRRVSDVASGPLRLYDSARREAHAGTGPQPRTMYVCGITPYDATHLGHAATMIAFDLINRAWRDAGLSVTYVQNVTDIDDPLLERAARDGEDWIVLGMRETALFREDMESLRILPPDHYVGAVESVPAIARTVADLLERGAGYRIEDGTGDVYFDLSSAPRFGYESNLDRETMLRLAAERGGDPDRPGKRDPLDPVLWRGAREGEPAWDGGPLGPGRPGWHIECAVIALDRLGSRIDVQGGGNDLIFPHHECSAAHAEVLTGEAPFARHYVHAGMIGLDGEKMSKSKGNLVFVSRLRADGVDPMALRLALMSGHYRADREWTDDERKAGEQRLARWREAAAGAASPAGSAIPAGSAGSTSPAGSAGAGPDARWLLAEVRAALADDLDTPTALAAVDRWCDAALSGAQSSVDGATLMAATVDALLGIRL